MCDDCRITADTECPGNDAVPEPEPPEVDELMLLAVACGLKPRPGWYRVTNLTREEVMLRVAPHRERVQRLRLQSAIGAVIGREHLARLLRARLAREIVAAESIKDLVEAVRVLEKLPLEPAASDGGPATGALDDLDNVDLEAAVAEAKRLLSDLGGEGAE